MGGNHSLGHISGLLYLKTFIIRITDLQLNHKDIFNILNILLSIF